MLKSSKLSLDFSLCPICGKQNLRPFAVMGEIDG